MSVEVWRHYSCRRMVKELIPVVVESQVLERCLVRDVYDVRVIYRQ